MLENKAMFWTPLRLAKSGVAKKAKQSEEPSTTTLDRIRAGQEVNVVQIVAGQSATRQLAQLGIRTGTTLKVRRSAPMGGPVLVDTDGVMVAIGRGMARKVCVQTLA
jgi:Fe2+ transport system protein FeoA